MDNMAVVFALQKGCIRDKFLQSVARSVWLLAAIHDITLEYTHIPRTLNVKADILSRVFSSDQTKGLEQIFQNYSGWVVNGSHCYPNENI